MEERECIKKTLFVDFERCTGCRICELACSLYKEGEVNPSRSRIHVVKWEEEGIDLPIVCQQCEEPLCEAVCPTKAITRNPDTGALVVDYNKCIGCRTCILACPFGGIAFDPVERRIMKCDLCEGEPKCAQFCPTEALAYVDFTRLTYMKKREAAKRLSRLMEMLLAPAR